MPTVRLSFVVALRASHEQQPLSFVSRSKHVARKGAPHVLAATLAVGTMLASSRAHADLLRPNVPTLTWGGAIYAWMPPHEGRFVPALRLSVVWTPSFSAYSIGIAGLDSFRSGTVAERASFRAPKAPWSLCIGPACPARAGAASDAGGQVASPAAGSTRFINGLGPAAAQALALFSSPVASKEHPVALRVSPIFALSGGGLEMRCAWW